MSHFAESHLPPRSGLLRLLANDWTPLFLLLLAWALLMVWHQNLLPMQAWDESRIANNALEMARGGHWFIPTYDGVSDHWNTKPPLLIWLVAALFHFGAPPLLALRLPSLLACLATVTLLWVFCVLVLKDRLAGAMAGVLLLTSGLYAGPHVGLTGDYDALLTFFVTIYVLAFWLASESPKVRLGWIAVCGVATLLAVFTKSVAGLLPVPGLLLYALLSGRLPALLRNGWVWATAVAVLALVLVYYIGRNIVDPGYIASIWYNDVGGRFAVDPNSYGAYYAIQIWQRDPFAVCVLPVTASVFIGKPTPSRSVVMLCLMVVVVILVLITKAEQKHYWYAAIAYPPAALAIALGFSRSFRVLRPIRSATGISLLLGAICVGGAFLSASRMLYVERVKGYPHINFAPLFEHLATVKSQAPIYLMVPSLGTTPSDDDYNPIAKFYIDYFRAVVPNVTSVWQSAVLQPSSQVAACDEAGLKRLTIRADFSPAWQQAGCVFGRLSAASGDSP